MISLKELEELVPEGRAALVRFLWADDGGVPTLGIAAVQPLEADQFLEKAGQVTAIRIGTLASGAPVWHQLRDIDCQQVLYRRPGTSIQCAIKESLAVLARKAFPPHRR